MTISVAHTVRSMAAPDLESARSLKFMPTETIPGGRLPSNDMVQEPASEAGLL